MSYRLTTQRLLAALLLSGSVLTGNLWPQSNPAGEPAQQPAVPTEKAAPPASQPQQPPQAQASAPELTLKVTTRLVVVDVVARDKKGQVIPDLQASDFKVTEDGKEQKISVFNFQHPAASESLPALPVKLPPGVYRNTPRYQPNRALNVLLVDALNTNVLNQAYVRMEMVKFLERLPQGQPIAIYTMGRKLRMVQDFTTDLTELKKVIQTFKGESWHLLSNPTGTSEVPMTLQGWALQTAAEKAPGLKAQIQDFAEQSVADQSGLRVQYTMEALSSLARMLSGYPGRKNLIWLSESIPFGVFPDVKGIMRSSEDVRGQIGQDSPANVRNTFLNKRDYVDQLALISNLLADAQVAVYPVDARGLIGSALSNVANNVSGQGAAGGLASRAEGRQAEELFQAHYSMRDIAEKTGGLPYYNRNDLDVAVRNGIDDGATYYTLGYYPDNKNWSGQFRKVQVSVNRPGAKLRYRAGYFAFDRAAFERQHPQQRDFDFSQALNADYPMATAIQFEGGVLLPEPGNNKVLVNYALDPHQISFEKGADGLQRAKVDCAVRVFSPKNMELPVKTEGTRVAATLRPDAYEKIGKTYFPCQLSLELPPGHYFLRLAVRDAVSGLMGSVNAEVTVPDAAAAKQSDATH